MVGKAIDIRVPGVKLDHLRSAAASLKIGGVGFYPSSNFVHVDTGRVRYWYGSTGSRYFSGRFFPLLPSLFS